MTVSISRRQLALAGIAYGLTQVFPAHANQPLKLMSPYSPGGGGDGMARALAEIFATRFETSTIVDNRPGAGGALGLAQGLKAQPDGNTLTVVASSPLASLPFLVKVPYDPGKDVTYIVTIAYAPILLVATSATKASTLEEFIEAGRKKQGGLSIASPGQGTAGHLMIAGIANKAKTNFLHVPYKDAGQRLTDSIAGTVDGWVENPTGPMVQQIRAGKLKLLAVAAPRRLADFPDVPTFAEAGYADVQFYTSWLLVGPKGLAPDLTDKYNKAVNAGIKSSEFAKLFAISYALPAGGTADECAKAVQAEGKLAAKVIKDSNIRLE